MNTIHEKYVKREDDLFHKYERLMGAFLEVFLAGTPETQKKVDAIKKQLCSEYTEEHKGHFKYKVGDLCISIINQKKYFSEQFNKKWVDKKELILQLSSCVQQNTKNASSAKNGLGC